MKNIRRNGMLLAIIFMAVSSAGQEKGVSIPLDHQLCACHSIHRDKKALKNDNPLLDNYDVKFYKIDVETSNLVAYVDGEGTVVGEVVGSPMSTLVLELYQSLTVASVKVNDEEVSFTHEDNEITATLSSPIQVGELFTAVVEYSGNTGEGMFTLIDTRWDVSVNMTLSEPFYAKDWFPVKERLADKADSVHVFITTDYDLMGVSNGLLTGTSYLLNGKVRHEWKSNLPITYYLISIAVADYQEYNIEATPPGYSEPIFIQNFVYDVPGCLEEYQAQIDQTIAIMDLFVELFGPYPFDAEKYGHYLWPWGGGMEHQTMTGMGNFSFGLIAHELAHSWFGNYVTCATWQDIWINEGFATYGAYLATENLLPGSAANELIARFDRAMRENDGSVYIPDGVALTDARIFSGNLSYNKGMTLLHMIRFILDDDDMFFQVLRDYIEIYADSVAKGVDFQAVLEDISGQDFTNFFDQWYFGFGYPTFSVEWSQLGSTVTLDVTQITSSTSTPLFQIPMEYRLSYAGGDTIVRVMHDENLEQYTFDINENILSLEIDPNNWVLNKEGGIQKLLGINDYQQSIGIFPNPSDGLFTIQSYQDYSEDLHLEVYSSNGMLMKSWIEYDMTPMSNRTMDLSSLKPGMYHIRLKSGDVTENHKVILK